MARQHPAMRTLPLLLVLLLAACAQRPPSAESMPGTATKSFKAVEKETGAGSKCGKCEKDIKKFIKKHLEDVE